MPPPTTSDLLGTNSKESSLSFNSVSTSINKYHVGCIFKGSNVAPRRKQATKLQACAWLGERRHDRRRLAPAPRHASAAGVRKIVWACLAGPGHWRRLSQ